MNGNVESFDWLSALVELHSSEIVGTAQQQRLRNHHSPMESPSSSSCLGTEGWRLALVAGAASAGTVVGGGSLYLLLQGHYRTMVAGMALILSLFALGSRLCDGRGEAVTRQKGEATACQREEATACQRGEATACQRGEAVTRQRETRVLEAAMASRTTFNGRICTGETSVARTDDAPATSTLPSASGTRRRLHALEEMRIAEGRVEACIEAVEERRAALHLTTLYGEETQSRETFYRRVHGACCEMVVGEVWIPVGVAGPVPVDGRALLVPLATVEGALVASVNRGCKALMQAFVRDARSVSVTLTGRGGMTRGPVFRAPTIDRARALLAMLENLAQFGRLKEVFDATSPGGHVALEELRGRQIGPLVFVRMRATTGAAMGMNMVSRGAEALCRAILADRDDAPCFSDCELVSLSGNYCTDKKPAAVNWIEGRGRSVVAAVHLERSIVQGVLRVEDPGRLVEMNTIKNLVGSAAAGSVGGFNAQVANVAAAVYLATGQDMAQVVDASHALTLVEGDGAGGVVVSLTMPCVEVGVMGGGTGLPRQRAHIDMLFNELNAGDPDIHAPASAFGTHTHTRMNMDCTERADWLAKTVCVAALAGELSLLASLCEGSLMQAHRRLNQSLGGSPQKQPARHE